MNQERTDAVKLAIVGLVLLLAAATAIATGLARPDDAMVVAERVWPILLFVVAVTIVAELAAAAGVFDAAAHRLSRLGNGRTAALWAMVVILAVAATAFLSLDTTAVLLTPVIVAVVRARRLDPLPFVFATVWLANTASLVLPVSNLTNLLAADLLHLSPWEFIALLGPSAGIAIVVTVGVLVLFFHRRLRGSYPAVSPPEAADPVLLRIAAIVVVVLLPLLVSGMPPWIPASTAALVLLGVFAWRHPRAVTWRLVPFSLVIFAAGLFFAVGILETLGSGALIGSIAGSGTDLLSLWRLTGTGLVSANLINNLPAYLLVEPVAGSPERLAALLIGVNAGSLITPWASLATLLWHQRLRADGVEVSWTRFVLMGLLAAPVISLAAVIPLVR